MRWNNIMTGGFSDVTGGLTGVLLNSNLEINWTAIACLISVTALILTTYENRKRFKKDWVAKVKVADGDNLINLASQYIANYQTCQTFTVDILMRETTFIQDSGYRLETKGLLDRRNNIILELRSINSQIQMLEILIAKDISDNDFFDKIKTINDEVNDFIKQNDLLSVLRREHGNRESAKAFIRANCEDQNRITKDNIEFVQKKAVQIYRELVTVKH